jgi:hypothetical protein
MPIWLAMVLVLVGGVSGEMWRAANGRAFDAEGFQMRSLQKTSGPHGREHRTPDQMFPMRNVESCEGR